MKRVLMLAYHFPPLRGSSGIQRTLRFVQHLPKHGWQPLVLSTDVRAYPDTSPDQLDEVPPSTVVARAFALDAARHLSIAGRYPGWLALPDRWASWYFAGVLKGLWMIWRYRPQVIWSTFPIATAHRIGATLAHLSGLPWVADFRDPMAHEGFPPDPRQWQAYQGIEEVVMQRAHCCVFTTPGAAQMYREKYPAAAERIWLIENGYDEEIFAQVEAQKIEAARIALSAAAINHAVDRSMQRFVLLHSGLIYPDERDPRPLFAALARLKAEGQLTSKNFCLRLRAPGCEAWLAQLAAAENISDLIEIQPPLPYRHALAEMFDSDALLILQASNCNAQIPAKLYEYLRSGKAILALTDPDGDTAAKLHAYGMHSQARLDSADAIHAALPAFIARVKAGAERLVHPFEIRKNSRARQAEQLAELLERCLQQA